LLLFICIVVALTPLDNRRRRADHHYYLEKTREEKRKLHVCRPRAPRAGGVPHQENKDALAIGAF
jgi:hypothetical protein